MPRRVRFAVLLAFLFHGLFIVTARYRLSYDAYTHMLFADHYARDWFSLWEPRWYTGFTVVSYPPLTHQVIAFFIPLFGFAKAYALVSWAVTTMYPLGIFAFAQLFTGRSAASYAALASAILLPIYVVAYVFAQFPFLTSTLIALFAAVGLHQYLHHGGLHNFALSVALFATSMASHHATLMVHPFLALAVLVHVIFMNRTNDSGFRFGWKIFRRLFILAGFAILGGLLVIWPFWQWGSDQVIQTPIDHLSRHNFFHDPLGFAVFFFPLYGPLVLIIPFLLRWWHPRFVGLLASFSILFLLGLGGTTPLPRLFFGDAWEWLTYDRFAFWACLTLTPFFGIFLVRLKWGWKNRFAAQPRPAALRRAFVPTAVFTVFAATALGAWFWPIWFPTQPQPVDMDPMVRFLNQGDRSQWRYLTFGLGNQYTHLNLLTEATTIDGSYHTARTLSELRESGVAEVDTSYWAMNGLRSIEPILKASGRYGVRWGFVDRAEFVPVLKNMGWIYVNTLSNGVQVWENPSAVLPPVSKPPEADSLEAFSWGVFPILALLGALSLGGRKVIPAQTEFVLQGVFRLLVGMIPISLCFWYFQTLIEFRWGRVYFTYTDFLFFLTDALVVVAVILWTSNVVGRRKLELMRFRPFAVEWIFMYIVLFAALSAAWSMDWRISLYISLHLGALLVFILSLREWSHAWKVTMFGLCCALCVQLVAGFGGFALQSTAFLTSLGMEWPGTLAPSMRGASVVQLADGLRILRAYGTLPHPNILGGLVLFLLLGPISLFLLSHKTNFPALFLLSPGLILLILTFSRSAWLGLLVFFIIVLWKQKVFDRKKLLLLIASCVLTIVLTISPLRDLIWTRVGNAPVPTEQMSAFGRQWLTDQALNVFRAHPLAGIGVGSFVLHLSRTAADGAPIEPVHNIPLLAATELGLPGLLLVLGLFTAILIKVAKAQTPRSVLASGMLAGLGIITLFDHYLWTLAPGRVLLGLALGLWMGQTSHDA